MSISEFLMIEKLLFDIYFIRFSVSTYNTQKRINIIIKDWLLDKE